MFGWLAVAAVIFIGTRLYAGAAGASAARQALSGNWTPTPGEVHYVSSDALTPVETPGLMETLDRTQEYLYTARPKWPVKVTGYDGSVMCKGVVNIDGADVNVIFPAKGILS